MILGWRGWIRRTDKAGVNRLKSTFRDYIWVPGKNIAQCPYVWNIGPTKGLIPHEEHDCGLYASHTWERLVEDHYVQLRTGRKPFIEPIIPPPVKVAGIVKGWGTLLVHKHCWRAEFSEMIGLYSDTPEELRDLSEYYNVPVFESREDLERHALHYGSFRTKAQTTLKAGIIPTPCVEEEVEVKAYGQPIEVALRNVDLPYLTAQTGLQISTTCPHGEHYTELVTWDDFNKHTDEVMKYVKHMHTKNCEHDRGYDLWQLKQHKSDML